MIGSALKKFAQQNGLTMDKGVAYGSLSGIAVTLSEGSGWKQIVFSTRFADPARRTVVSDALAARDLKKEFWVTKYDVNSKRIQVMFQDKRGIMDRMQVFLNWFLPLLRANGASGAEYCAQCGQLITGGKWVLLNGNAYHFHPQCAERVRQDMETKKQRRREEDTGNYFTGLLGALVGAILGAVVWAIVLQMGYVAALVGLLIGFLAEKGYNLCKGKQGKGKIVILIVAVIVGVVLGTFFSEWYGGAKLISSGELPGLEISDIPGLIMLVLERNADARRVFIGNIGTGLLFAALGVFALLRQTGKDLAGDSYVELR